MFGKSATSLSEHVVEDAPTDRGIVTQEIDVSCVTFEQYKAARCSNLLQIHYETRNSLIDESISLAEMLEEGYKRDVLQGGMLRG